MAESAEHHFLKSAVNDVLERFSSLKLYTFTETDRKVFDFSSLVERDWTRPVVGQVLWRHTRGAEKDIRTLLHDTASEIKVYVAKDTIKYRQAFAEIIADYRRSGKHSDLFKLKPIWVPADFDADALTDQRIVLDHLQGVVVNDILFNVVFGKITAEDVAFVLYTSGIPGLQLAILYVVATEGFVNISHLSSQLRVSPGPIREKLLVLAGAGMLESPQGALKYQVTAKGRLFLDVVKRVRDAEVRSAVGPELSFVLQKLGCAPVPWSTVADCREVFPSSPFIQLMRTVSSAGNLVDGLP